MTAVLLIWFAIGFAAHRVYVARRAARERAAILARAVASLETQQREYRLRQAAEDQQAIRTLLVECHLTREIAG